MANLRLVPWAEGDRQYFTDEESYQAYLRSEEELRKEPLNIGFDWKYFLKILFAGE